MLEEEGFAPSLAAGLILPYNYNYYCSTICDNLLAIKVQQN